MMGMRVQNDRRSTPTSRAGVSNSGVPSLAPNFYQRVGFPTLWDIALVRNNSIQLLESLLLDKGLSSKCSILHILHNIGTLVQPTESEVALKTFAQKATWSASSGQHRWCSSSVCGIQLVARGHS